MQIALFTTRKVDAMEELTWVRGGFASIWYVINVCLASSSNFQMPMLFQDYGIDFNDCDHDSGHPMKPFHCLCGSPFCRDRSDMKGDVRLLTYVRRRRRV